MVKLIGLALAAAFVATAGFATIPKDAGAPVKPAAKEQPVAPAPLRVAPFTRTNSKKA
jgi:hypothetical protein